MANIILYGTAGTTADGVIHCVHFVKDGESAKCDALKAAGGLGCPVVISVFLSGDGVSSPLNNVLKTPLEEGGEGGYAEVLTPAVTEVGLEVSSVLSTPYSLLMKLNIP